MKRGPLTIESKMQTLTLLMLLKKLYRQISNKRRLQLLLLIIIIIIVSLAEMISIGAVIPFLAVLANPERAFEREWARPIIELFRLTRSDQLMAPLTIIFGFAAIFAGTARLSLVWLQTRLAVAIGAEFSIEVYRKTLFQPYLVHISRNSSEVIAATQKANGLVGSVIQPILTIIGAMLIIISISSALILINPYILIITMITFILIYVIIAISTKRKIFHNGKIIAFNLTKSTKNVQEGLSSIRDVLLEGSQKILIDTYSRALKNNHNAVAENQLYATLPRYGIETIGLVLISAMTYLIAYSGLPIEDSIPILGAVALGAQKMLPLLQQIYASITMLRGGHASAVDALRMLDQPVPEITERINMVPLQINHSISLQNMAFKYSVDGEWVFQNINIRIKKGKRIGIIGASGGGKSSLLDLIMGLLPPNEGSLIVDDVVINQKNLPCWQMGIAHVPQDIYLSDKSIAENIAFGTSKEQIDLNRVKEAAIMAEIYSVISRLPKKFDTEVGERGVRFSGGERQRIGIARAIYKQAQLLILDEATSALDNETERKIMDNIETISKNTTILIVAHRLSTLTKCDEIFEVRDKKVYEIELERTR